MRTYEIKSMHMGESLESKQVELHIVKDEWEPDGRGPKIIEDVVKLEDTHDNLDEMFGATYDVGDKFELVAMHFAPITSEEEEEDEDDAGA